MALALAPSAQRWRNSAIRSAFQSKRVPACTTRHAHGLRFQPIECHGHASLGWD
jgi:hypothetical protein